jgi:glycerol-3-phosphate dehydrogenase
MPGAACFALFAQRARLSLSVWDARALGEIGCVFRHDQYETSVKPRVIIAATGFWCRAVCDHAALSVRNMRPT